MPETIRIGNTNCEFLLEKPTAPTTTVVLFLPGISGGAFSERFQPVVDRCIHAGFAVARINAWKNAEDVATKNLSDIFRVVGDVTTYFHREGYMQIFGIGKSFGGAIMLAFPSLYISRKVLWAPAIGVSESNSNIDAYMTAPIGTLDSLLDLQLNNAFLEQNKTPTLIIHGTADNTIPFANSEKIVSLLPHALLVPIVDADHSYKTAEHEAAVTKATIDFLKADPTTFFKPSSPQKE